jgi:uncharacterized membrane protein YeaQ/YmgE (transglycosylase-associated protein family)
MHLIGWLLIHGVLAWIASRVMETEPPQNAAVSIALGFAGASLAGWLIAHATRNESDFTLAGLFVSFMGAIALLGLANLVRERFAR